LFGSKAPSARLQAANPGKGESVNIIFVSNNMAKARTLSLPQFLLLLAILISVPSLITAAIILPQPGSEDQGVNELLPVRLLNAVRHNQQQHMNALAQQLGEIQARIMRLDALSARLAEMAGVKDINVSERPAQGGPLEQAAPLSSAEIDSQVAQLLADVQERTERLDAISMHLLQQNLKKTTFPSGAPVSAGYNSSSYGWRPDPFTGQKAFHKGLDFMADSGTPIHAAADGIVTQAERAPDYGNIVRLDHGFGLDTRYAHLSGFLVKVGDRVSKGQPIGTVGSTGRSTGPHLHYEVRLNGVPLDPRKYLKNNNG
jgi:murein DD-endopeptidase MepM/ murein hydrolase activator NlpD